MLYQELSFSGEGKYWIRTNYKCFAEQILKINRVAPTSFLSLRNRKTSCQVAEARRLFWRHFSADGIAVSTLKLIGIVLTAKSTMFSEVVC
jgi:hypothetical protein